MTSLKIVSEEKDDFLWSLPEQFSLNDFDRDACLQSLYEAIKEQFLSLRDVDNEDIVLQDEHLRTIDDGDALRDLLESTSLNESRSDEIVLMVMRRDKVSVVCM